ncbi:MAG: ribbon-helix-helix domain-containing protein [bacterium]|jgi:predicted DNA-binding ribbon-helix-helix protein
MKNHLIKRSFRLAGHATSIALEAEFWTVLEAAAAQRSQSLAALVAEVDTARATQGLPLASALRLAALAHARTGPAAAIRQDQSPD